MFKHFDPKSADRVLSTSEANVGMRIPPISLLPVLSPDDWETFTQEWLWYYKNEKIYTDVQKYSGSGDLGLDVVAYSTDSGFNGSWDSFQCKHYDHALYPTDIYSEIGKIIYHSYKRTPPFNQNERTPKRHVFVCPHGVGISVGRLLKDPNRLKRDIQQKWDEKCVPGIQKDLVAPLSGHLLEYFDDFDFSIFEDQSAVDLIATHSQTPFHSQRFGGGLPSKAPAEPPPEEPDPTESVYLQKLMDAYGDHLSTEITSKEDLEDAHLKHYLRQRVLFYSAESLRNFARDRTPAGTFKSLQDDIYNGVVDIEEGNHPDGLAKLKEVVRAAGQVAAGGNALYTVSAIADRQGICHQLANDDRLSWVK